MWCENCNRRYDDGITVCPECAGKLTEYEPILSVEEAESFEFDRNDNQTEETVQEKETFEAIQQSMQENSQLLVTVPDQEEARRIVAMLTENRIPAFEKESEEDMTPLSKDFEDDHDDDEFDEPVENDIFDINDTLYDVFVPEEFFPVAMSLLLEQDKDSDITMLEEFDEIEPEIEINLEKDDLDEETKAIAEMAVEEFNSSNAAEGTISDKTDHSDKIEKKEKSGFFSIFRYKK